ncbi:MAG: ATP-binding protein, partial [Paludibacteraceae bacterium]|nr:ATP-binding protein [Paludibacteraceae bacterium]
MGKNRQIEKTISSVKNKKQARIIVFTGARQVGKTTLVKQILPEYEYLSIEDPVLRKSYLNLSATLWKTQYPKAILDEVQKEPLLIESIKATYDIYDDVRYVLLGSSQLLLLEKVRESLAGRCIIYELYPLTLPELATTDWNDAIILSEWQKILNRDTDTSTLLPSFLMDKRQSTKLTSWQHYLKYGAYPALVDEEMNDEDKYVWLKNYVNTYLERDVRDLASFRDLEPFIKLQRAVATYTGSLFNASNFARDLGVNSKTVQRYLEYLRLSYQVIILPAWERNTTKRLTKAPKIHFMDNGVLQAVLQKRGGINGNEFESLIISEIYKQAKNIFANVSFYHLRTQDGREVDLLVETQNGYYAFEIKMADRISAIDARHLINIETILDKPLICGFILSNDNETRQITPNIIGVNATMFLG